MFYHNDRRCYRPLLFISLLNQHALSFKDRRAGSTNSLTDFRDFPINGGLFGQNWQQARHTSDAKPTCLDERRGNRT
jgi:hypothetical protein